MPKTTDAPLVRKGGSDYAMTEKHGLKKVRTWNPHEGEWRLTDLGKKHFKADPTDYNLSLPVHIHIDKNTRMGSILL